MTTSVLRATLCAALVCLLAQHPLQSDAADMVSEQLVVAGTVKSALALSVDDLRAFPATEIETITVARRVDDKEVASVVRGVRLTAVLDRAGLLGTDLNEWKHTIVLATATDGYQVAFSWPELFNTDVGAGALIVFERDGKPLADREGRIALVSARDTKPGPRSVRSLARLSVSVVKE